jgi:hypothetical protein
MEQPDISLNKGGFPKLSSFKDVIKKGTSSASKGVTNPIKPKSINLETAFGAIGTKAMGGLVGSASKLGDIGRILKGLNAGINGLKGLLLSLAIILVCVAIIVLIYIIARVVRLRGFGIGHSERLDDFMDTFHNDMNETRKLIYSLNATKSAFTTDSGNLIDMLKCPKTIAFLGQDQKVIKKKFDTYFKYYDIMGSSMDKWFYSNEIEGFAEKGKTGDQFLSDLIKEIDGVRKEIKECVNKNLPTIQRVLFLSSISEKDYTAGNIHSHTDGNAHKIAVSYIKKSKELSKSYDVFQSFTQQFIDMCIGISVTNLYLDNYFVSIKDLHNSRRFSFFNFLIILIKPYVIELIFKNIVNKWKELFSSKSLKRSYTEFEKAWLGIGKLLSNLPTTLAGVKTSKQKPKEDFTESDDTDKDKKEEEDDKEDVVEHFGFLKGLMSIGQFFLNILKVAVKIAELVTKPFEMLLFIIKMVIGIAIGLVLIIIYTILTIPPFVWIIYGIYFFVFKMVLLAVMSYFYFMLFIGFAIVSGILWVLDLILGGFTTQSIISRSMRCENSPDVWYTRANIINDNIYTRALFCQSPCAERFSPSGLVCTRTDSVQPSYCPQAQVYRIYKGLKISNPYSMGEFKPSLNFYTKTKELKELEVQNYFIKRQDFLQKCSKSNDEYDYLIKTICANSEYVKLPNEDDRAKLKGLCKQIYCYGNPKEDFCYKYDEIKGEDGQEDDLDVDGVLRKIIKLICMIIIAVIIILMFLYNS